MNDEQPVHMVIKDEQPRKPGQSVAPVIYAALCGTPWEQITDYQNRVTCDACLRMLGIVR
jgi:hypothetical protein